MELVKAFKRALSVTVTLFVTTVLLLWELPSRPACELLPVAAGRWGQVSHWWVGASQIMRCKPGRCGVHWPWSALPCHTYPAHQVKLACKYKKGHAGYERLSAQSRHEVQSAYLSVAL